MGRMSGGADWLLGAFVKAEDQIRTGMDVTLYVGGRVITGRLIGGREYLDLLRAGMEEAWLRGAAESGTRLPEGGLEAYRKVIREAQDAFYSESVRDEDAEFVHLADARFLAAGVFAPGTGSLWRGKLGAVDGFTVGLLSQTEQ